MTLKRLLESVAVFVRSPSKASFRPGSVARRLSWWLLLAVVAAAAPFASLARPAGALPTTTTGTTSWRVLLCKFKDHPEEPLTRFGGAAFPDYFTRLLTPAGSGTGNLFDYWRDQSYGRMTLGGTSVKGWFVLPYTKAQEEAKGAPGGYGRETVINDCVAAARTGGYSPAVGHPVMVVLNGCYGSAGAGAAIPPPHDVLIDPCNLDAAFVAHEMGHRYGMHHAHSSTPGAPDQEYGDVYDLMAVRNAYMFGGSGPFGPEPPGLNAIVRSAFGWLPQSETVSLPFARPFVRQVALTALNAPPSTPGIRMTTLLVAAGTSPTFAPDYYVVELHQSSGWDRGIPQSTVLVHEVRSDGDTYLLLNTAGAPRTGLIDSARNISVDVDSIAPDGSTALVTVRQNAPALVTGMSSVTLGSGWNPTIYANRQGFPYQLAYNTGSGAVAFEGFDDVRGTFGLVGSSIWSTGWTSSVNFQLSDGVSYLLSYKNGTGDVAIDRVGDNGSGVSGVWASKWTTGWDRMSAFVSNGSTYLLSYKSATGAVAIDRINPGGNGVTGIWSSTWSPGWTSMSVVRYNGSNYLLSYKVSTGDVDLDQINGNGNGVMPIWATKWSTGWTSMTTFSFNGSAYVLSYKSGDGSVDIDRLNSDGTGTTAIWSGKWSTGWSKMAAFSEPSGTYLSSYKTSTGVQAVDRLDLTTALPRAS